MGRYLHRLRILFVSFSESFFIKEMCAIQIREKDKNKGKP